MFSKQSEACVRAQRMQRPALRRQPLGWKGAPEVGHSGGGWGEALMASTQLAASVAQADPYGPAFLGQQS